ncbi:MAG: hypothetical protein H0X24_16740 [Ktedonobacterales bacterium]|nr:hypothetical protein [Ktedonobacterales bacterium]
MSERNEFERDVREALRAEAEAGPDYRVALHARVMARVLAASHAPSAPLPIAPALPPRRMVMMVLGATIVLLAVLTIIALTHGH